MSYTAKHYVKISGRKYTPREIIDIPIPEGKLNRLLRLKAIAPNPSAVFDPANDAAGGDEDDGKEDVLDKHARQFDNLGYDPSDDPKETQDKEEPTEEESDEEAEAPEIDVMDGIVSAAEEAPPKKTTSKGRKKT